jgi:hypothetical protein
MLWVLLYTAGLTPSQKASRRAEIQSDMHEEFAFGFETRQKSLAIYTSIASRSARGLVADVLWRLEEGRDGERVVQLASDPPLPWFTMWFVSAVIVAGCVASTQAEALGDTRVMLAAFAAIGAGILWLGLYLATHRFLGPVCIAGGTACIALGLWWTRAVPFVAIGFGIAGLRRAQRLETLIEGS